MQLSFRLDAFAAVLLLLLVAGRVQSSSLPPRALDSIPELEDDDLRKREMVILVHAVCGFLAFQVFAPIGKICDFRSISSTRSLTSTLTPPPLSSRRDSFDRS